MDVVQPQFGVRIRKLRLDRGLSQLALAEKTGLSEDQISKVERGKSWVGELTLDLLAKALDVPHSSLFDYSENEEFLNNGGLKVRAPRKAATLIVRNRKLILVSIPDKAN